MYSGNIAAVSYLNTIPMIYGIESDERLASSLLLLPPSGCARAFVDGRADVALIPVGALDGLQGGRIITNYCIGAHARVRTVMLMSRVPVGDVERIWLDSHSLTSVALCRLLAREYWGVEPEWAELNDYSAVESGGPGDAFLLIGDKVFDYEGRFAYNYDMAECWQRMTSLPFVFAVWVARDTVDEAFVDRFARALSDGVSHIRQAIAHYGHSDKPYAYSYLTDNISFELDAAKKEAMHLFLESISR